MSENRPPIPEPVKRAVRKRCGFGCVICGKQLYDYDHMIEYEIVDCHEESNLTLLCKEHHGEKTSKNLTLAYLKKCNDRPFNVSKSTSTSRYLYYSGRSVEVHIGGNIFKYNNLREGFEFIPLQIDNKNIISFVVEDDALLLNFSAYDIDNNKIVEINKNEIIHSSFVWDAEWKSNRLTLRKGTGEYLLRLEFITPNILKISKGIIHYNATDIILDNDILFVANNKSIYSRNTSEDCKIGISLKGYKPYPETIKEIKRYYKRSKKRFSRSISPDM